MLKYLVLFSVSALFMQTSCMVISKEKPVKTNAAPTCRINIHRDLIDPQPLLLHPESSEFVYPNQNGGIIGLEENQLIELFCDSGFTIDPRINSIKIACVRDDVFRYQDQLYRFNKFFCLRHIVSVAYRLEEKCYNEASLITIGFNVVNRYVPLFDVCFDETTEETYYTQYKLTRFASSAQAANAVSRPNFRQDNFFPGKNVDVMMQVENQIAIFTEILGSSGLANSLITRTGNFFLARGHLAANADFVFRAHQRATFWFINTAPQWQRFNAGNWVAVEIASRQLAATRATTLDVYTGTYGIMSFEDITYQSRNIFIDNRNGQIPAVSLFYKILIDNSTNSGIVLIGVNNVRITLEQIKKFYIICNDVSDKVHYVRWNKADITRGFPYACDVNEFLKVVPHLQGKIPPISNLLL